MITKIKEFVKEKEEKILFIFSIIFISTICFCFGFLVRDFVYKKEIPKIKIVEKDKVGEENKKLKSQDSFNLNVVIGNKRTKIYHFPWCSGAKTMKEENKIYFSSEKEAIKAGFRKAKNCKRKREGD